MVEILNFVVSNIIIIYILFCWVFCIEVFSDVNIFCILGIVFKVFEKWIIKYFSIGYLVIDNFVLFSKIKILGLFVE